MIISEVTGAGGGLEPLLPFIESGERTLMADQITPATRVWSILKKWPATCDVFRSHGCPDMRSGIFAITARVMPVGWAARFHRVPIGKLLRELNACAEHRDPD